MHLPAPPLQPPHNIGHHSHRHTNTHKISHYRPKLILSISAPAIAVQMFGNGDLWIATVSFVKHHISYLNQLTWILILVFIQHHSAMWKINRVNDIGPKSHKQILSPSTTSAATNDIIQFIISKNSVFLFLHRNKIKTKTKKKQQELKY